MQVQRLQFEVTDASLKEIEALMDECEIATKKEFFNNTITLFKWAIKQVKNGEIVASVDEANKVYRELTMPVLELLHHRYGSKEKTPLRPRGLGG